MNLKVDDKVKILDSDTLNSKIVNWKEGDVGYVSKIHDFSDIFLSKTKGGVTENGNFKEGDLKLVHKFKTGDKVKILNKSTGMKLINTDFKKGDIGIVRETEVNNTEYGVHTLTGTFSWTFDESDLELIQKEKYMFKSGDKVKILGKTTGDHLGTTFINLKKGDIVFIKNYDNVNGRYNVTKLKGSDVIYYFNRSDLELVKENKEEEKMKYIKGDRELRIISVLESPEASESEKNNFIKNMTGYGYKFTDVITIDKLFMDYVLDKDKCFIDWLVKLDHVRIEKFKPFKVTFDVNTQEEYNSLYMAIACTNFSDMKIYENSKRKINGKNMNAMAIEDILDRYKRELEKYEIT